MLEKRTNADYDITDKDVYLQKLPFINTDFLVEEVANLKLKQLPNGKYSIDKVIKRFNKDRFSALEYGLWYIKTFEDNPFEEDDSSIFDYLVV
jgi:ribonucleoside-diphosphate reductase alpha chain